MATLSNTLYSLFINSGYSKGIRRDYCTPTEKKFMEIPLCGNEFEIPLLAMKAFEVISSEQESHDCIVVNLEFNGCKSTYKSVEALIKDALCSDIPEEGLIKIALPENTYYISRGIIFKQDMTPLFMMSWLMEKVMTEERLCYAFKRPLVRISPRVIVEKADAIQKLISGRLLSTLVGNKYYPPYYNNNRIQSSDLYCTPKVVIDEIPFCIRGVNVPSISVTNSQLLELVDEHVDEMSNVYTGVFW